MDRTRCAIFSTTLKASPVSPAASLLERYQQVRQTTDRLCSPLAPEDCVIQSMPDASPIRWHLAHTTWFFETFVLKPAIAGYEPFDPAFEYLFNSYYNQVGEQFPRSQRGLLSRPLMSDVHRYRQAIDQQMVELLAGLDSSSTELLSIVELGLQHEQQHQELMLTDVKHLFSCNPLWPVYESREPLSPRPAAAIDWLPGSEGVREIGYAGDGFHYDNEGPRHEALLQSHEIASRPVTNAEYLEFIDAGGYQRPELWLSLGWSVVQADRWNAPLYWQQVNGEWHQFTLAGLVPVDRNEPVCHVSYFEADAYARWAGCRLPSEAEWERMTIDQQVPITGNFVESGRYHPAPAPSIGEGSLQQAYGDVWEWTSSPYTPYPGYAPPPGAIGEYNGKFMCNQYVLRGGSCATSQSHIRPTYRNFFPPEARWQFTGIRLAR
ncbi:ergothioneine biosynthesis protein EgtB [Aeoliella mucimassa]|uniref:Iron(II)-dependent oxidoreductase EgtB n=1 Tax=Aeoliella mucimassa TaxID=2527972 RepID=A0A518AUC1_9BACT|nr:ergothioneine biosynthesis protein EgtB [Aeoliella mucimassa]QDU58321.1 Iron(II)-dependent oxidoreductase EgtB [Aeoliella mucimassa]